jgi:NitT/TauT family transport system substrate-binding protein
MMRANGWLAGLAAGVAMIGLGHAAQAQSCSGTMRHVNIGVAVSPPNVVHTVPYVAKALGIFAQHCLDANIIQFDGGDSPAAVAAVAQGSAISTFTDVPISRGMRAKLIWGMAPVAPQAYVVAADIKTPADLKGKRLSAAGGGVGGFNWLLGREMLKLAGLTVHDATFIAGGTAGRLPGLLAGQVDGVVLHPEDVYLAEKDMPGLHVLRELADVVPNMQFNSYGASDDLIAKDHDMLRDTIASMMLAARAIYQQKDKVIPVMMTATGKPKAAVEFAYDYLTKNCIWAVNTGFDPKRMAWTEDNDIANGDIAANKKLSYEQIVDTKLVNDALAAAGGAADINGCKR